jgi:HPt (histidine-containing phosphotransfer) domain-containing protein
LNQRGSWFSNVVDLVILFAFGKRKKKSPRCIWMIPDYLNAIQSRQTRPFAGCLGEIWPLVIEKQGFPGLNREIIANALQQVAWLDPLKREQFDQDALWNRVHGDVTLLRELVALFATEVPVMLAKIEKAIKHGSPSDLEKASHKMKGSMLQFSAHAAANIARQLEENGRIGSMAGTGDLLQNLRQEISELQQTLNAMVRDGMQP